MISVNFTNDIENIVATEHLYQWDNGQKLSISGLSVTADIHFANKKSEKALVVTPTVTSGTITAPIPNSLLTEPYPIIAYVYAPSDNGAKTIKSVTIAVEPRKQPSDFVVDEDEGITTIESISQQANAILQNATNQINTAISGMQTDYTDFKNTIQGELDEMKANTTIPNADTVDGKHASAFMQFLGDFRKGSLKEYILTLNQSGFIYCGSANCTDLPVAGKYYIGQIMIYTTIREVILTQIDTGKSYVCHHNGSKWYNWNCLSDGGNANTANTAGTLATTPTNVCLRNISFGTADPQVTDSSAEGYVTPGALYGQYEEVTT